MMTYNSEQKQKANIRLNIAMKKARREKMSRRGKQWFLAFIILLGLVVYFNV